MKDSVQVAWKDGYIVIISGDDILKINVLTALKHDFNGIGTKLGVKQCDMKDCKCEPVFTQESKKQNG